MNIEVDKYFTNIYIIFLKNIIQHIKAFRLKVTLKYILFCFLIALFGVWSVVWWRWKVIVL